jgi:hypothetical protein
MRKQDLIRLAIAVAMMLKELFALLIVIVEHGSKAVNYAGRIPKLQFLLFEREEEAGFCPV